MIRTYFADRFLNGSVSEDAEIEKGPIFRV